MFSKQQIIIQITVIILVCLVCIALFLHPAVSGIFNDYANNKTASVSNVNFRIPSPSAVQLNEFRQHSFIDDAYPYYDIFTYLKLKNAVINNFYVMLVDSSDKNKFPFFDQKLCLYSNNSGADNFEAYVDYSFHKKYKVNTGDTFTVQLGPVNYTYSVKAIILNCSKTMGILQNDGTENMVVLTLTDKQKKEIENELNKKLRYSGAFIRSNNHSDASNYLKSYKPLGQLRDMDVFKTIDDYNRYLNDFNNRNYSSEISHIIHPMQKTFAEIYRVKYMVIVLIIINCVIMICYGVLFSNNDTKQIIQSQRRSGRGIKDLSNSVKNGIFYRYCLCAILMLLFCIAYYASSLLYFPLGRFILFVIIIIVPLLLSGSIFSVILSSIAVKSIINER